MASDSFKEPPSTTKVYFETMIARQLYLDISKKPKLAVISGLIFCIIFLLSTPDNLEKTAMVMMIFLAISLSLKSFVDKDRNIPFAVNFNHPLMSDEPMGEAQVFVWLMEDNKWVLLQESRVRLIENTLLGGFDLVYDDEDYTRIGHFTSARKITGKITRSMMLLNQAIVLAKLSNEEDAVESSIADDSERRIREKQESELLQRSWLEDEQEIEIEGPLAKFLSRE